MKKSKPKINEPITPKNRKNILTAEILRRNLTVEEMNV